MTRAEVWQAAYVQAVTALHAHYLTHTGCYADEENALDHDKCAVRIADVVTAVAIRCDQDESRQVPAHPRTRPEALG